MPPMPAADAPAEGCLDTEDGPGASATTDRPLPEPGTVARSRLSFATIRNLTGPLGGGSPCPRSERIVRPTDD